MKQISLMYSDVQTSKLKTSLMEKFSKIIDHGQFIQGPEVSEFEKLASNFTKAKYAISCANGTDALTVALIALDVKPMEVIFTPSFTYVATAEAISIINAIPYFVDIDPVSYNICVSSLKKAIKDAISKGYKIRAIISVDLFGNPVDYAELLEIAKEYNLILISDSAQSFGGEYKNQKVGTIADITTTSFFPTKPLGCYGDGGMIFTNNDEYAARIKSICFHGRGEDKYHHIRIGMNSRLDSLQAAVLLEKMNYFDAELARRNSIASNYTSRLTGLAETPNIKSFSKSAWAVYSLKHKNRDEIIKELHNLNIPSAVYYKTPLHLQPAYVECYKSADLAHSINASNQIFCLPMHGYLTEEEVEYIITNTIKIITKFK